MEYNSEGTSFQILLFIFMKGARESLIFHESQKYFK